MVRMSKTQKKKLKKQQKKNEKMQQQLSQQMSASGALTQTQSHEMTIITDNNSDGEDEEDFGVGAIQNVSFEDNYQQNNNRSMNKGMPGSMGKIGFGNNMMGGTSPFARNMMIAGQQGMIQGSLSKF